MSIEQYSYDAVGNRLNATVNVANRLLEDSTYTYAYDDNGNMIQKTSKATGEITTYTFDPENRLIQVTRPGMTAQYRYDPFGRRIQKNMNGTITGYIYDKEDILFETDAGGNVTTEYIHGTGTDEPIAMVRDGQKYYYHADALGSITAITDQNGNMVQKYEYDSFGNIVFVLTPNFIQPYTYTGREYDAETGMYYYRARYYDAGAGRFISEDPIGVRKYINRYNYAFNAPVNLGKVEAANSVQVDNNGNIITGYSDQDWVCSSIAAPLNRYPCAKNCCLIHDICYAIFKCNWSSWGNWSNPQACQLCNAIAMGCISKCAGVCND